MSLPADFHTPAEYFTEAMQFLREHCWIYQHANTCFIKAGVLDTFPMDYAEYFLAANIDDLNQFPCVYNSNVSHSYSENLQNFRQHLRRLIPAEAYDEPDVSVDVASVSHFRKVNPKKQHEIHLLANLINAHCSNTGILIDYGAGLGYLSEALHTLNSNYLLLGLEADETRVNAAQLRLQQNFPTTNSQQAIKYRVMHITDDSSNFIVQQAMELAEDNYERRPLDWVPSMAIIGLHACADLAITSIRHFIHMPSVSNLIIMPCCYHKLALAAPTTSASHSSAFVNFPLSACLRQVVLATTATQDTATDKVIPVSEYLNRPFLRLACQQTVARWETMTVQEHTRHGQEMFRRGAAEAIIDDATEIVVKSRKQHRDADEGKQQVPLTAEEDDESFAMLRQHLTLKSKDSGKSTILSWNQRHERQYNEIIEKYKARGHKLAEGLTCLQTAMQKLCENIVLYDRLCYIKELAASERIEINVKFKKLFNEKLSPRCYVLIAEKL